MKDGSVPLVPLGMEEEINLHINKVRALMDEDSALLVGGNVNIFYLTGRFFRGYVWLPKDGEVAYFVVKPQVYAPAENLVYIRKPELIADELHKSGYGIPARVGLEMDVLPYLDVHRLMGAVPADEYFNASSALRGARMVKTPYEIGQMRFDGRKQVEVYSRVSSLYKPGMTDLTFQIAIERELRMAGCLGFARVAGNLMEINMGSVLAGDNADNPSPYEFAMGGAGVDLSLPGGADGSPILPGQTVMVDMNGAFNAYQTDMTRVWSLGKLPDIAFKAQECSVEILHSLQKDTRPGMKASDLYFKAVDIAEKAGLKDFFMGHSQQSGFVGHGVGIELNEQPPLAPRCSIELKESMTLAIEPKFVLPGIGALGSENTYVVRPDGLECLTPFDEGIQPL